MVHINITRLIWKALPTSTIICRTINLSVWLATLIYYFPFGLRIRNITLHCQATYINQTRFFSSMKFSVWAQFNNIFNNLHKNCRLRIR